MAVRAVASIQGIVFSEGNPFAKVLIGCENAQEDTVYYQLGSPSAVLATAALSIAPWAKDYAEGTLGQEFDVGDTVRVIYPT